VAGHITSFVGTALAFLGGEQELTLNAAIFWGDLLAVMAGLSWGATTVVVRSTGLSTLPAKQVLFYQLIIALVALTFWSFWTGQATVNLTTEVIASLIYHGVGVAFLSFLLWFWLLTHYKASQLGALSFMTPLMGVLMGNWWLDEKIEINFVMGAGLIIAGIFLVSSHGWLALKLKRLAAQ